jgi:hypothetical protein
MASKSWTAIVSNNVASWQASQYRWRQTEETEVKISGISRSFLVAMSAQTQDEATLKKGLDSLAEIGVRNQIYGMRHRTDAHGCHQRRCTSKC